jgi:prepilin-type N-terminal cleavage/methylation domain-containing protein
MYAVDRHSAGFTLVEILIVVVLLAILASIVMPQFKGTKKQAENAAFVSNVKLFATAFQLYQIRNGQFPPDVDRGVLPNGMSQYIDPADWTGGTPLGGRWDWDANVYGVVAGVSVVEFDRTAAEMAEVDALIDDGNPATGAFRNAGDRYTYAVKRSD